jgi:hypothetical protein
MEYWITSLGALVSCESWNLGVSGVLACGERVDRGGAAMRDESMRQCDTMRGDVMRFGKRRQSDATMLCDAAMRRETMRQRDTMRQCDAIRREAMQSEEAMQTTMRCDAAMWSHARSQDSRIAGSQDQLPGI